MKTFMLFAGMFFACAISFAQPRDLYELKKLIEKKKQPVTILPSPLHRTPHIGYNSTFNSSSLPMISEKRQAKLLSVLPNGNKIYALPQDNMTCIVPDMEQFNTPVIKPDLNGTMPNGSIPYNLIPQ